MSNWTIITAPDVSANGVPEWIAAAEAAQAGVTDDSIIAAVDEVRGAVSAGNMLDADTTKVPNKLRSFAARRAFYTLCRTRSISLDQDWRDKAKEDASYFNRIIDARLKFDAADNPAGSGEMNPGSPQVETITDGNMGSSRAEMKGL